MFATLLQYLYMSNKRNNYTFNVSCIVTCQHMYIRIEITLSTSMVVRAWLSVADLEGVPWVPWNPSFERLPSFLLYT